MTYIGVDGCKAGWVAVIYSEEGYETTARYETIQDLWSDHCDASRILIDIPIGLRESSNGARPCDVEARNNLGSNRNGSVFSTPIREVARRSYLEEIEYQNAKAIQEAATEGSLSPFTWGIARKIGEVDYFLLKEEPDAKGIIHESHPEVCFWALNGGGYNSAMSYSKNSKTGQPAAAFWERIDALEEIDSEITNHVRDAGTDLAYNVSNNDLLDAFALAVTASPKTGPVERLPDQWPDEDTGDPAGLPMEILYSTSSQGM